MYGPTEAHEREGWGSRQISEKLLRLGTYNIWNEKNRGLESTICGIDQGITDVGVLQDTKIIERLYRRESSGFQVTETAALSTHRGDVVVF